ncbi:unnamed protein product [Lathyrus sativus]|nr:unnamed protein product [Lathyrus sativus]
MFSLHMELGFGNGVIDDTLSAGLLLDRDRYIADIGTGVTVINNLAQVGSSQGVEDITILLSVFSFFNFVRLLGGVVSEHFVRSRMILQTVWVTCT